MAVQYKQLALVQNIESEQHIDTHQDAKFETENALIEDPTNRVLHEERHSERIRQLPKHLLHYKVELPPSVAFTQSSSSMGNNVVYHISNYTSYTKFSKLSFSLFSGHLFT